MITDIVDVHRLETGRSELSFEDGPVDAVVSQAIESLEALAAERDVSVEVTSADVMVRADAERLAQAVGHLLSNALKV